MSKNNLAKDLDNFILEHSTIYKTDARQGIDSLISIRYTLGVPIPREVQQEFDRMKGRIPESPKERNPNAKRGPSLADFEAMNSGNFQKKTDLTESQAVKDAEIAASKEPKELTNESKLADIYLDGLEKAKKTYQPKEFIKEVKELGYTIKGKTLEDLWSEFEAICKPIIEG